MDVRTSYSSYLNWWTLATTLPQTPFEVINVYAGAWDININNSFMWHFKSRIRLEGWTVKPIKSSISGELTAFQAAGSWTFHWQVGWILNIDTGVCAGQQSIKPADNHQRTGERWKWIGVCLDVFSIRVRAPWETAQKVYWLDFCVYGWTNELNNNTVANLCVCLLVIMEKNKTCKLIGTKMFHM